MVSKGPRHVCEGTVSAASASTVTEVEEKLCELREGEKCLLWAARHTLMRHQPHKQYEKASSSVKGGGHMGQ